MSDDEDYMSDKFLQASEQLGAPSLLHRHADKREMELLKKKAEMDAKMKEKNKSVRVMEEEKREEGLSSAISSDNKGFEMLMKMGYKPGQGIGKTQSGIAEPIGVDLKTNRLGLGREKAIAKKAAAAARAKSSKEKVDSLRTDDFRARMAMRKTEQLMEIDLSKSQKVCGQLDAERDIEKPRESWFWPQIIKTEDSEADTEGEGDGEDDKEEKEEEEEEEEKEDEEEEIDDEEDDELLSTNEKLEILTKYLRETYFYCSWCGMAYYDENDLRDNCPGWTRNDH